MISKVWTNKFSRSKLNLLVTLASISYVSLSLGSCNRYGPKSIDRTAFIETAIRYEYNSVYESLEDLRQDYPGFTPKIQPWSDKISMWLGIGLYSIELPEALILIDINGNVRSSRSCGSVDGNCTVVPPQHPELGVVGTLQYGAPNYEIVKDYEVNWSRKNEGTVFISEHCFSAFSNNAIGLELKIAPQTQNSVPIGFRNTYGYYLIAAYFQSPDKKSDSLPSSTYSSKRISKSLFLKSASCNQEIRNSWPRIGVNPWKR